MRIRAVSLSAPEVYNALVQTREVDGKYNSISLSCEVKEALGSVKSLPKKKGGERGLGRGTGTRALCLQALWCLRTPGLWGKLLNFLELQFPVPYNGNTTAAS